MISEKRISEIALRVQKDFKVNFDLKFISYRKFKEIAKKSPLIQQVLDEGSTFEELKIPALIYHQGEEHVYMCKEIINKLLKEKSKPQQEDFVKAIIYHEIFHIFEKAKLGRISFIKCLKQEERVCKDFQKRFPSLYELGRKIHSESTNQSK